MTYIFLSVMNSSLSRDPAAATALEKVARAFFGRLPLSASCRKKTSREEWLNWRRENVNASEAAALIGADKYRTKLQLYREKRGAFAQEQTKAMARGLHMEAAILCHHYYDDPDLRIGCSPEWEGHANVQLKTVARPVFEQGSHGFGEGGSRLFRPAAAFGKLPLPASCRFQRLPLNRAAQKSKANGGRQS